MLEEVLKICLWKKYCIYLFVYIFIYLCMCTHTWKSEDNVFVLDFLFYCMSTRVNWVKPMSPVLVRRTFTHWANSPTIKSASESFYVSVYCMMGLWVDDRMKAWMSGPKLEVYPSPATISGFRAPGIVSSTNQGYLVCKLYSSHLRNEDKPIPHQQKKLPLKSYAFFISVRKV